MFFDICCVEAEQAFSLGSDGSHRLRPKAFCPTSSVPAGTGLHCTFFAPHLSLLVERNLCKPSKRTRPLGEQYGTVPYRPQAPGKNSANRTQCPLFRHRQMSNEHGFCLCAAQRSLLVSAGHLSRFLRECTATCIGNGQMPAKMSRVFLNFLFLLIRAIFLPPPVSSFTIQNEA